MRMDALLYLPTREVMTKERSSKITLPMKRLSQGINWGRGSYLWTPGWSHLKACRTREEKGCERKMRGQDTDARERLTRKELSQLRHEVLSSAVREYFCEKPVFRRVKHLCDLSLIFFLPSFYLQKRISRQKLPVCAKKQLTRDLWQRPQQSKHIDNTIGRISRNNRAARAACTLEHSCALLFKTKT